MQTRTWWGRGGALALALLAACASGDGPTGGMRPPGPGPGPGPGPWPSRDGAAPSPDGGAPPGGDLPPATCTTDLAGALDAMGVPGAVAGITKHGRLVCVTAAGQANIEYGRPVTADTV